MLLITTSAAKGMGFLVNSSPGGATLYVRGCGGRSSTWITSCLTLTMARATPLSSNPMLDPQPRTWNGTFTCCSGLGPSIWRSEELAGSGWGVHALNGDGDGGPEAAAVFRGLAVGSLAGDGPFTTMPSADVPS